MQTGHQLFRHADAARKLLFSATRHVATHPKTTSGKPPKPAPKKQHSSSTSHSQAANANSRPPPVSTRASAAKSADTTASTQTVPSSMSGGWNPTEAELRMRSSINTNIGPELPAADATMPMDPETEALVDKIDAVGTALHAGKKVKTSYIDKLMVASLRRGCYQYALHCFVFFDEDSYFVEDEGDEALPDDEAPPAIHVPRPSYQSYAAALYAAAAVGDPLISENILVQYRKETFDMTTEDLSLRWLEELRMDVWEPLPELGLLDWPSLIQMDVESPPRPGTIGNVAGMMLVLASLTQNSSRVLADTVSTMGTPGFPALLPEHLAVLLHSYYKDGRPDDFSNYLRFIGSDRPEFVCTRPLLNAFISVAAAHSHRLHSLVFFDQFFTGVRSAHDLTFLPDDVAPGSLHALAFQLGYVEQVGDALWARQQAILAATKDQAQQLWLQVHGADLLAEDVSETDFGLLSLVGAQLMPFMHTYAAESLRNASGQDIAIVEPALFPPEKEAFVAVLRACRGLHGKHWYDSDRAAPALWRETIVLNEIAAHLGLNDKYLDSLVVRSCLTAERPIQASYVCERILFRRSPVRLRTAAEMIEMLSKNYLPALPFSLAAVTRKFITLTELPGLAIQPHYDELYPADADADADAPAGDQDMIPTDAPAASSPAVRNLDAPGAVPEPFMRDSGLLALELFHRSTNIAVSSAVNNSFSPYDVENADQQRPGADDGRYRLSTPTVSQLVQALCSSGHAVLAAKLVLDTLCISPDCLSPHSARVLGNTHPFLESSTDDKAELFARETYEQTVKELRYATVHGLHKQAAYPPKEPSPGLVAMLDATTLPVDAAPSQLAAVDAMWSPTHTLSAAPLVGHTGPTFAELYEHLRTALDPSDLHPHMHALDAGWIPDAWTLIIAALANSPQYELSRQAAAAMAVELWTLMQVGPLASAPSYLSHISVTRAVGRLTGHQELMDSLAETLRMPSPDEIDTYYDIAAGEDGEAPTKPGSRRKRKKLFLTFVHNLTKVRAMKKQLQNWTPNADAYDAVANGAVYMREPVQNVYLRVLNALDGAPQLKDALLTLSARRFRWCADALVLPRDDTAPGTAEWEAMLSGKPAYGLMHPRDVSDLSLSVLNNTQMPYSFPLAPASNKTPVFDWRHVPASVAASWARCHAGHAQLYCVVDKTQWTKGGDVLAGTITRDTAVDALAQAGFGAAEVVHENDDCFVLRAVR